MASEPPGAHDSCGKNGVRVIGAQAAHAERAIASGADTRVARGPAAGGGHTGVVRCSGASVSVVIPVHNRATAVRRAIASVLAQTCQDVEIIVVDDGSTDGTAAAISQIDDPRVRVIGHERSRGASAARNTGIRASRGEFVAFLDSDDEWLPSKLERQLKVFARSDNGVGLVYTGAELLYDEAGVRRFVPRRRGDLRRLLLRDNCVGGCSVGMVRRRVLEEVGGFDESLPARQDVDLWFRISTRYRVDFVPDALVRVAKSHDAVRITTDVANRLKARELFCRKYRTELVREGMLHLYLRESGWKYHRQLRDARIARQHYIESLAARPLAPLTYAMLLLAYVPMPVLDAVAGWKRRVSALRRQTATP